MIPGNPSVKLPFEQQQGWQQEGHMQVSEIMSAPVEFIAPDATIAEAAALMGEIDSGALPVGGPDDMQGIITDRDILFRVVAGGKDPGRLRVREVMSSTIFSCRQEDSVAAVMDLMASYHVRRLPVADEAGIIVGWVTLSDISCHLLVDSEIVAAALRELSEGSDDEPATDEASPEPGSAASPDPPPDQAAVRDRQGTAG